MSVLFIPEVLELHKITVYDGIDIENQNVLLTTEMSFGTHERRVSDPTVKVMRVDVKMSKEAYNIFEQWLDVAMGSVWKSTLPDPEHPLFARDKFYQFSFKNGAVSAKKDGRYSYSIELEIYWHYRVPPVARY